MVLSSDAVDWVTVYDGASCHVGSSSYWPVAFLAIGGGLVFALKLAGFGNTFMSGRGRRIVTAMMLSWVTCTVFLALMTRDEIRKGQANAARARGGAGDVVTGTVDLLEAMPYSGHATERIGVSGKIFRYTGTDLSCCYRVPISHGGVLAAGANVRLRYEGNCILRVEVER